MNWFKDFYDWAGKKTRSKYADYWFTGLFFLEAVLFVPINALMILFCLKNKKKTYFYASIATLASIFGGIWGYLIGAVLWNSVGVTLVSWVISETTFSRALEIFKLHQNWAVLIAGFTPLPYKALTLSAGFCKLPLIPFILCSLVSRGTRFFLIAFLIKRWGKSVQSFINQYFNYVIMGLTLLGLGVLCYVKH